MSRNKDDEEYMREMNKMNPDDVPLDIDMYDDFDFPEQLNKKQLEDLIGSKKNKKKIKVANKKGKMRLMAKEGDFADREEFESEKEKKEVDMNKKAGGGMIKKYSRGGDVTDVLPADFDEKDREMWEKLFPKMRDELATVGAGAAAGKSMATNKRLNQKEQDIIKNWLDNKKKKGGMIRKGYARGGAVTSPKQKCRGGGAATRGLGFTIS